MLLFFEFSGRGEKKGGHLQLSSGGGLSDRSAVVEEEITLIETLFLVGHNSLKREF